MGWRVGKRVAIVGAGPGGVSAALAFSMAGYDVRLFEQNRAQQLQRLTLIMVDGGRRCVGGRGMDG